MPTKTKADQNGPFKAFNFEEWLRSRTEGFRSKLESEAREFGLPEVRKHLRNAQREQLLAIRSVIDKAIERLDREE